MILKSFLYGFVLATDSLENSSDTVVPSNRSYESSFVFNLTFSSPPLYQKHDKTTWEILQRRKRQHKSETTH